jgi:two-component system response regulator YesN
MGCPPIEYLRRVRLREARLLLARGKRVKETAHAVGFGSQHYFSRAFKQRVGMCPTEFAALHARDQ